MWPFGDKKAAKCQRCTQRLALLEWSDLRHPPEPEDAPYRCYVCSHIFCFQCLDKREGRLVGAGSHEVVLRCPECSASEIKYATTKPLPEDPERTVARMAKELNNKHGKLLRSRCMSQESIVLEYEDGTTVDGRLGGKTLLLTCGYAGRGPTLFHVFLTESGFAISRDEIYDKRLPYTLESGR